MRYKFCKNYRVAVRYARLLRRAGYCSAVLLGGEVRFWRG